MGTTIQFLIFPERDKSILNRGLARLAIPLGGNSEWLSIRLKEILTLEELEQWATAGSASRAIGGFVEDSDYAYVFAVEGGGVAARLLFNEQAAMGYREGEWALSMITRTETPAQFNGAQSLAMWSVHAPNQVSTEDVSGLLSSDWTFAEDALGDLLTRMGLPNPVSISAPQQFEGAIQVQDRGTYTTRGRTVDKSTCRYVRGEGLDFVGIWDRTQPGPPVKRFPKTPKGRSSAEDEWERLVFGRGIRALLRRPG